MKVVRLRIAAAQTMTLYDKAIQVASSSSSLYFNNYRGQMHGESVHGQMIQAPSTQDDMIIVQLFAIGWSVPTSANVLANMDSTNSLDSGTITVMPPQGQYYNPYAQHVYNFDIGVTMSPRNAINRDEFYEEEQAFLSMKDNLLKNEKYAGAFVAILNGKLVDSDSNEGVLAERCYRKYGYRPIYFNKVERIKRIIRLPSPRRIH